MKKLCAVIDTNVLVAALLTKNSQSATVQVMRFIFDGTIVPLYHQDILDEYNEVLHRPKFHFKEESIALFIQTQRCVIIDITIIIFVLVASDAI